MEDNEFRGFLEVFPVIRSRNYRVGDLEVLQDSTSSAQNELDDDDWKSFSGEIVVKDDVSEDPFWQKLRSKTDKKVGPVDAEKFCKIIQHAYEQLVYEMLSTDAIPNFVNSKRSPQ